MINIISVEDIVKKAAMNSQFLNLLNAQSKSSKSVSEIGTSLSASLGKNWSESSKLRYISAGKRWLKELGKLESEL